MPYHHVHTAPPDPRSIREEVPEGISALILRCMEKDPAARYQSAAEVRAALEAFTPGPSSRAVANRTRPDGSDLVRGPVSRSPA